MGILLKHIKTASVYDLQEIVNRKLAKQIKNILTTKLIGKQITKTKFFNYVSSVDLTTKERKGIKNTFSFNDKPSKENRTYKHDFDQQFGNSKALIGITFVRGSKYRPVYVGSRGGQFYQNSHNNKQYCSSGTTKAREIILFNKKSYIKI